MLCAASRARSCCERTITAAEPMKQPCGCSVSKSSGMSPSDAGRMPPDAPPGQVAVELVPVLHAAAVLVDQLAQRDAGRAPDARRACARGRTPRTSAVPCGRCRPWPANQSAPLVQDVAHPEQRFHVVLERRPAEQAHLRDVRRAQARHAALALDRLDHRRLFAADVGARAAAQVDRRQRARRIGGERCELAREHVRGSRVLVAQVDVDGVDADRPRGDQHAFEEAVRVALEVVAVLERAGLALVDVDRHQPRRGLGAHDLPLAPGGKAGAAQAAQRRVLHRRDAPPRACARRRRSRAGARSRRPRDRPHSRRIGGATARRLRRGDRRCDLRRAWRGRSGCGRPPRRAPARSGRRTARRGRARRASCSAAARRSSARAPAICARERIAHAHGQRRRRRLAFLHHVEVVVERRDLVHLGHRELHLGGERDEVRRGQAAVACPGCGAGARSAGRARAARRPAVPRSARRRAGRGHGPSGRLRRPRPRCQPLARR